MGETVKFTLSGDQIPRSWVNLLADLPEIRPRHP